MNRIVGLILVIALLIGIAPSCGNDATADDAFQEHAIAAAQALVIARSGLQRAVDFARSRPDLFDQEYRTPNDLMTRQDKLSVWSTWSSVLDCVAAMDIIRGEWKEFNTYRQKHERTISFVLNHAAFLASYRYALEFIDLADRNPALNTILDEDVPELGMVGGTWGDFKFRFLNVAIATQFAARQVIHKHYAAEGVTADLRAMIEEDSRYIWRMGKGKGYLLTMKNALAVVREAAFEAWFPVQKNVSQWMGDTKVYRKGVDLVSGGQIEILKQKLKPGDILFERHEWYLSNMGLPGFWTHAAMYVGTPEERRFYFSDPETVAWVKAQGVADGDLESLLKQRYPHAYTKATTPQADGHAPRILEAISEGVSFTSLEYSGASDSIGVLRPRLAKPEKALAMVRGFHFSGRPYDFNFDFATDAALVCSEVVYKAYAPSPEMKGVVFPLTEIMGRKVSTPNDMVRQFDAQFGKGEAQADFVIFLDGFEREKRAVTSTRAQFRKSWRRPNWHILIQKAPEASNRQFGLGGQILVLGIGQEDGSA